MNSEIEVVRNEKSQLENVLVEKEIELKEAKENSNSSGSGGSGNDGPGGALSLAEREELIRLRSEVSEYEVEFRGLKNQDITIRKLESEFIIYVCTFSYCTLSYALTIYLYYQM